MAIDTLFVQYHVGMLLLTRSHVCMIGNQFVELAFMQAARKEQNQQKTGYRLLYDGICSQDFQAAKLYEIPLITIQGPLFDSLAVFKHGSQEGCIVFDLLIFEAVISRILSLPLPEHTLALVKCFFFAQFFL